MYYELQKANYVILTNSYFNDGLHVKDAIKNLFDEGANSNKCVSYITKTIKLSKYDTVDIEEVRSTLLNLNLICIVGNDKRNNERRSRKLAPCPRPKAEGSNKYLMMRLL